MRAEAVLYAIALTARILSGMLLNKLLLIQREGEEEGGEGRERKGGRKKHRQKPSLCATHKIPNSSLLELM